MNSKLKNHVLIFSAALVMCASIAANAADQASPDQPQSEMRVVSLQHGSASEVAGVVSGVFGHCNIGVEHRSNSIVAICDPKELSKVVQLIAQLDKPVEDHLVREFIRVPDASPNLKRVLQAGMSHEARVEIDPLSELVVVVGQPRDIAYAHETITMIENRPSDEDESQDDLPASYRLHIYFVATSYDPEEDNQDIPPLPSPLESVGRALTDYGFNHPRLLASMIVQTLVDEPFELAGKIDLTDDESGQYEVEVEGVVDSSTNSDQALLKIEGEMRQLKRPRSDKKTTEDVFEVEATLVCMMGEHVVLSASPADGGLFDAVAMVVYVAP